MPFKTYAVVAISVSASRSPGRIPREAAGDPVFGTACALKSNGGEGEVMNNLFHNRQAMGQNGTK